MKRKLIHFDKNEAGNLHCDTCGYDLPGLVAWGPHLIGYECPKCSDNMLTERDYLATSKLFARIDWLNKWFSWLPFLATADVNDPDLQTVGIKIHNSAVEIEHGVPPVSQNCPTVPNLSRTSCVFEIRNDDGSLPTISSASRAWCRTHGFDCPELSKGGQ